MENHNKMKLWEELSQEEKEHYRREKDELDRLYTYEVFMSLYPNAKNIQEIPKEMAKQRMQRANIDPSSLEKWRYISREFQAAQYYYSNWSKSAIEVFYSSFFDEIVSNTHPNRQITKLLIKGKLKTGNDNLKLLDYIEEKIQDKKVTILEEYTWGVDWYGLGMPGIDKKDVLYQWFNINDVGRFKSFIHDLIMIKWLEDCINELSYPNSEKKMYSDYCFINQRKNEKDIESIKEQITNWIYNSFASYIEETDIIYFKLALFRFLNGEDVEVREIPIKNQNLKSADLNSFIWVIWYYWNSIKTLKQEKLISFITKFFQNVYKDFQEKGHPKISNTTIKSHLKDNTGNKIKIPKELMKGNKTK